MNDFVACQCQFRTIIISLGKIKSGPQKFKPCLVIFMCPSYRLPSTLVNMPNIKISSNLKQKGYSVCTCGVKGPNAVVVDNLHLETNWNKKFSTFEHFILTRVE